jgi:glutaconyl-CoA/methylmalonyl-CoA decarboxylase subunit gamma
MKYTIKIDEHLYNVEIEDLYARPIVVIVDGERIEVEPQYGTPVLATVQSSPQQSQTTFHTTAKVPPVGSIGSPAVTSQIVRAPIPGVIVSVLVRPGDEVVHGQELCTIEAMKMRNNIRSSRAGRIGEVLVGPGQTVNHNDPLMSFAESS